MDAQHYLIIVANDILYGQFLQGVLHVIHKCNKVVYHTDVFTMYFYTYNTDVGYRPVSHYEMCSTCVLHIINVYELYV